MKKDVWPCLSHTPGDETQLGFGMARTETSRCQTYIVFTHAGLSADKNKSPPWLICAWLTNCITAQSSRSCGKPRCTEAWLRGTLTPLSSQRGSHRNSGHEVVSAELGHSVVPSPPAAPLLQPQRLPATKPTLLLVSQHLCPKAVLQAFWGNLIVVVQQEWEQVIVSSA